MRFLRGVPEVPAGGGIVITVLPGVFDTGSIVSVKTGRRGGQVVGEENNKIDTGDV
jgi:hypothetical protein